MKYVHPTNKNSGTIVHSGDQVFTVVDGEVAIDTTSGLNYSLLIGHGFVLAPNREVKLEKKPK